MESRFISQSKDNYARDLMMNGSTSRSEEIANLDTYTPVFKQRLTHEQAEPAVKDLNEMIKESYIDINALVVGFRDAGRDFKNLMTSTDARLQQIKRQLLIEKEKLDDLNILCNQYTDFNSVVNLDNKSLSGNYSYENGIIGVTVSSYSPIDYSVMSIDGNGYEGNAYVYKADKFLKDTIDTSNRRYINDNSDITVYEYSRLTASNSEKEVFPYINFDSVEAKVTITLSSTGEFNKIKMALSSKDTFITAVATSTDGVSYKNILQEPIEINNDSLKYEKVNYISNSGLLCFPSTRYLKITLESNGVTDDIIAFEKIIIVDDSGKQKAIMNDDEEEEVSPASYMPYVSPMKIEESVIERSAAQKQARQSFIPEDERYIYDMTTKKLLKHTFQ